MQVPLRWFRGWDGELMDYKDYYKILGVGRNATEKEVKQAYRRLARKHHPDVNPGNPQAEARFKEINEAHEVLSDPEKRRKYDQLGAQWQQWQRTGGRPQDFDWSQWFSGQQPGGVRVEYATMEDLEEMLGGLGGFSDFFRDIFGGMGTGPQATTRGRQARTSRGQDIEHEVEISLAEASRGTSRRIEKDGRRLEVKIPPGVHTGSRVRIAGGGAPGVGGGPSGNLYLKIKVAPHPVFRRVGDDLYCDVAVDLYTAVLGGEVKVPSLQGKVLLTIPPETQDGKTFRLKGQGMTVLSNPSQRGDLFATVHVRLPQALTAEERELFGQLARLRKKQ